jgi:CubicO group peptidase (beta-lactamase class C family)
MGDNVTRLAALPLMFQPASDWEYGLSTDVLGHVIEVVTGQTLEEFFQERIFRPLGMRDTCFHVPPPERSRVAAVYRPREDKTIERLPGGPVRTGAAVYSASYPFQEEGKYFSGGAGLVSTVHDYYRFLQMLLNGGVLGGTRMLKEEVVQEMVRDQTGRIEIKIKSHGDGFGLGFGVVTKAARDQGLGSVGTYSWGGFYHTYFWVDPEEELIGIFMSQLYPWDHLNLFTEIRKRTYEAILE